jgi:hypothetical protein
MVQNGDYERSEDLDVLLETADDDYEPLEEPDVDELHDEEGLDEDISDSEDELLGSADEQDASKNSLSVSKPCTGV